MPPAHCRIASSRAPKPIYFYKMIFEDFHPRVETTDLDAIRYVLIFVKESRKYSEELKESILPAPRKWKKAIIDTLRKHP